MEDLFVPFEKAFQLKELGFNEKCINIWFVREKLISFKIGYQNLNNSVLKNSNYISAPLWNQAFDWFSDKYYLNSHCDLFSYNQHGKRYYYQIINHKDILNSDHTIKNDHYYTIDEARINCLDHLIKLIS